MSSTHGVLAIKEEQLEADELQWAEVASGCSMRVRMRLYLQSFYARRVMMSRCRERLKVPPPHTWVWELESVGSSGLIRGRPAER